jgi:two-component sensor histidine kinase
MAWHPLLKRQLKKSLGIDASLSPEIEHLLTLVNEAYTGFDDDKELLEHSLELTSMEFVNRFHKINEENNKLIEAQKQLVEQEKKLELMVKEKDVLLQEIHHRVKNNLALVSGLLYLQTEAVDNSEAQIKLKEAQLRIQSMAMIHEMLYSTHSFSKVDLKIYLNELVSNIAKNFKPEYLNLEIDIHGTSQLIEIDKAIPIALLANEITVNSMKYAFPNQKEGKFTVTININESNELEIKFSDNGIGITNKDFTKSSSSIGYMLINTFIDQLEGSLQFCSNHGAHFFVSIPLMST